MGTFVNFHGGNIQKIPTPPSTTSCRAAYATSPFTPYLTVLVMTQGFKFCRYLASFGVTHPGFPWPHGVKSYSYSFGIVSRKKKRETGIFCKHPERNIFLRHLHKSCQLSKGVLKYFVQAANTWMNKQEGFSAYFLTQ